jgi:dolichyldiphosphatase
MCHLRFRHRFTSCGYPILDRAWRVLLYVAIGAWAVGVAYSRCVDGSLPQQNDTMLYGVVTVTCAYSGHFNRYYLTYHTPHQILWGFAIGVLLGLSLYILTELIPRRYPTSLLGRAKDGLLRGQVMTWLQIRDGWDVWSDAGREGEWVRWRGEWEKRRRDVDMKRQ